jgi:predicted nucleic acid-binding Zn ribbon protein
VLQKISDPDLTKCSSCGQDSLSRLVSAPSIQFKGTGWYATDYKDKGKEKSTTKSDDKSAAKQDGSVKSSVSPETKSESKSVSSKEPSTKDSSSA